MHQGLIRSYLDLPGQIVFFMTDDPAYRTKFEAMFKDDMDQGTIYFGPTIRNETQERGCSSQERAKFKRATSLKDAMIEFAILGLMDEFIGTAGSTVSFIVEAINARMTNGFKNVQYIGDYDVPKTPTKNFRDQMREFVRKHSDKMRNQQDVSLNHEQANVLDFLNDHHLEEMHQVLTKCLNGGPMLGSKLGSLFLDHCRVAKLNKDRFQQIKVTKAHSQHWLKSLLKGKLRQWSAKNPQVGHHIDMDEDGLVTLRMKPTSSLHLPSSSSSSGSQHPMNPKPKKVQRTK